MVPPLELKNGDAASNREYWCIVIRQTWSVGTPLNTIMIDSKAANRLAEVASFWGATMRVDLFKVRNFKIVSSLAFCLAMLPAASQAFTQEDQRRLCTGDVFRLCSSEIPDVGRITACMRRQRASLSQGCRSVFGKPAEQSASASRRSWSEWTGSSAQLDFKPRLAESFVEAGKDVAVIPFAEHLVFRPSTST
jgi:hypothetical protein